MKPIITKHIEANIEYLDVGNNISQEDNYRLVKFLGIPVWKKTFKSNVIINKRKKSGF